MNIPRSVCGEEDCVPWGLLICVFFLYGFSTQHTHTSQPMLWLGIVALHVILLFSLRNENTRGILINLTVETIAVCLVHWSYGYNYTSICCCQKKQHYKTMLNFPVPLSWVRRGKTQQYTQNKGVLCKIWDIQLKKGKSSLQRPETASQNGRSSFLTSPFSSAQGLQVCPWHFRGTISRAPEADLNEQAGAFTTYRC